MISEMRKIPEPLTRQTADSEALQWLQVVIKMLHDALLQQNQICLDTIQIYKKVQRYKYTKIQNTNMLLQSNQMDTQITDNKSVRDIPILHKHQSLFSMRNANTMLCKHTNPLQNTFMKMQNIAKHCTKPFQF